MRMTLKASWRDTANRALRSTVFIISGLAIYPFLFSHSASSQVITKITETTGAGDLGTRIVPSGNTYNIVHGTPSGNNLFHSFHELSLASGDIARFQTATLTTDATVQNILGRVTGGNPSQLFGTIDSATFYPQASLFLMNPNGIVFGPTATLNVGGSVTFTTAHYLRLAEANGSQPGIFSANPSQSNILTSAPVSAFGFLNANVSPIKPITIEGSILSAPVGQSLSLVGGNISISSGSDINAPSGEIRLASAASGGEMLTNSFQNTPNLNNESFSTMGNIDITRSTLDVSGSNTLGNGSGGTIVIRGGRLVLDAGIVSANTLAGVDGARTAVDVRLTDDIRLKNAGGISSSASSTGLGGNISIKSQVLTLLDGSSISTFSAGEGASGDLSVEAVDSIHVSGLDPQFGNGSALQTITTANATGGNLQVKAGHLTVGTSGNISTTAVGAKRAGNLTLEIDGTMTIIDGGAIFSNGSNGSGVISVRANEVTIRNHAGPDQRSRIENIGGNGETGSIDIYASRFLLSDDARVNMEGDGNLGQIKITSDDFLSITNGGKIRMENAGTGLKGLIELESPKITLDQGIIQTLTVGPGDAATVNLKATNILLDGGKVDSSTCFSTCGATGGSGGGVSLNASKSVAIRGQFVARILGGQNEPATPAGIFSATGNSGSNAGDITLSAQTIDVSDGAQISSQTSAPGDAGNILIDANDIMLGRGATITAASTGTGNAGNITIQGPHSSANTVSIDGIGSGIFTSTENTGAGGNIFLTARQFLSMNNGALISASSTDTGDAGNISIDAGQQLNVQDSSITTEAKLASGGNIDIKAIDLIRVANGKITSSVQGGPSTAGGNITIDPKTVLLQNAQILANAEQGTGGNIEITTPLFLKDPTSDVDASSRFGLNGTVTIQSPTSNLSGTVGQLASKRNPPQVLLQNRCVALAGGEQSTFILTGRDTLPANPGGWQSSPVAIEHWTQENTEEHASGLMVRRMRPNQSPAVMASRNEGQILSLRGLTPPGFLVRTFAAGNTGCAS